MVVTMTKAVKERSRACASSSATRSRITPPSSIFFKRFQQGVVVKLTASANSLSDTVQSCCKMAKICRSTLSSNIQIAFFRENFSTKLQKHRQNGKVFLSKPS
ncbi:Uncharacterised protein [Vibrio cholerae]|nr:Uncharacterised protein [Vibrio cholerae]